MCGKFSSEKFGAGVKFVVPVLLEFAEAAKFAPIEFHASL